MANGRHCHMFSGGVLGSRNTDVKYSKMANGHHRHMFSGEALHLEIQMLSTVK